MENFMSSYSSLKTMNTPVETPVRETKEGNIARIRYGEFYNGYRIGEKHE